MKASLFWNARGMGEADKVKFLKETIVEHNILFGVVHESKKTSYGADWLNNISDRKNFFLGVFHQ